MTIEHLKTSDLIPYARNAKKHDASQVAKLAGSIREFGFNNPVLIDKDNGIIAGHGRVLAAQSLALESVPCIRLGHLTDTQRRAYILADNRLAEIGGGWDEEMLKLELADLAALDVDVAEIGFGAEDLAELEMEDEPEKSDADAEPQIDKAEELRAKWGVELGQLWELGDHRILCGDSTKNEDVERVMGGKKADIVVTDPPYGVEYVGGTTKRKALAGDENPDLYEPSLRLAFLHSTEAAPVYLWHSDSKSAAVSAAVSAAGYERRCTIIWNKNQAQFGAIGAQYKTKHEPCYYLFKKGKTPNWSGPTNEVTVWDVDRNRVNENHPTEKPIECMARPIRNHDSEFVYEPFSGSGTTIIACEQLGRKCRAIEISPAYVAVAIQRWADATGKEPKRLA
jgi:DNA modification methylase